MASGSFNLTRTGSTSQYITFKCTWSSTSNGSAANTSTVTVKVTATKSSSSTASTYGTQETTVNVGGTSQKVSGSFTLAPSKTITLFSKSYTVKHNDDGSKKVTISVNVGGNVIYANGSATVTLDNIPRYATVSQSLSSRTETAATMAWTSDSTIDYIWYSTNNGSSWTGINIADGKSGSYTINGLSPNTAYNIKTRVRRKDSQLTTDSTALKVTTYAYPYANNMPNFNVGDKLTIGIYNPLKRSVTVNILGADGSQISNDTTTGTSITGYNGSVVVNRLLASLPNAKSGTYKVKVTYGSNVTTKTGGTYTIGSAYAPTIGALSYKDTNSTTTAITGDNQLIIRNKSTVQFTAQGLAGNNGATIASAKVNVNGNSYNMTLSGSTATVNNVVIDSAIIIDATITVTDSRGISASKLIEVTMLDWTLPSAIITLQRQQNFYSATDINVNADFSSLNGQNSVTIKARYKKVSDSSYSSYVTLQDGITSTLQLDNLFEWNVQVVITDRLNGSTTYNLTVPLGMPIFFVDRLLQSVGINCFPQDEKSLEVLGVNILKAIQYQSGDYFSVLGGGNNRLVLSGMLTNSAKEVWFTVPLPKSMGSLTPTVSTLKLNIRVASGGYLLSSSYVTDGYDILTDSNLSVIATKSTDNMLTIEITNSTAWSATNNTPVIIAVENIVIDFE